MRMRAESFREKLEKPASRVRRGVADNRGIKGGMIMSIFQLCYISRAAVPFSTVDLTTLLEKSRESNQALDVTGLLLYDNGSFIQLLEGPMGNVVKTFSKVIGDPRHTGVQILFQANVEQRTFPEWDMGFCDPRDATLKGLPGYSEFFSTGFSLDQFKRGSKARLFFIQFRDGIWRSKLEFHPVNAFSAARV
jgi:hypothetical protein